MYNKSMILDHRGPANLQKKPTKQSKKVNEENTQTKKSIVFLRKLIEVHQIFARYAFVQRTA